MRRGQHARDDQDRIALGTRRQAMAAEPMQRAFVGGVELEYEAEGAGEPVVLIHAGVCARWFRPLLRQPDLTDRYRLVRYHRVGYAGSGRVAGPVSIGQQAAHCRALMRHLDIEQAHVVGHSSSANMALQLALDAPEAVRSLALLEPALLAVPTGTYGPEAVERYRAGDKAGAVETWMRGVCGPAYAEVLERTIPGALEEAVADADTFFGQELPAVRAWSFGPEEAARVTQPALAVLGAETRQVTPVFDQRHELLLAWLPRAESFVLPGATHLLHLQNPTGMAAALAGFFARHPLPAAADPAGATS
jgi:pimeloyl-ACP methyl ester carboxylesterase